jgi:hypothetical protein
MDVQGLFSLIHIPSTTTAPGMLRTDVATVATHSPVLDGIQGQAIFNDCIFQSGGVWFLRLTNGH